MVKPRENRVPIMMSDEELSAVEDWRFENRVATRSEAVRRLVQIGLIAHKSNAFKQAMHTIAHFIDDPNGPQERMKSGLSLESDVKRLCRIVWEEQLKIRDFLEKPLADAFPSQREWEDFFEKVARGDALDEGAEDGSK